MADAFSSAQACDWPGKQQALVARRTINPALMTFEPTNRDLFIDNAGIHDHNSAAPTLVDRRRYRYWRKY